MSDHTFRVIQEAKVGSLAPEMQQEWDRLYAESKRLREEQHEFEQAMDAFAEALQDAFPACAQPHMSRALLRVGDNGDVYAEFCTCPECQATLHGLTVSETVEKMYESNLIPATGIHTSRLKAQSIDAKNKRTRSMRN